ncbi:MAG: hypothetical protein ACE5H0_15190, partial [Bacteroidota bacterium]
MLRVSSRSLTVPDLTCPDLALPTTKWRLRRTSGSGQVGARHFVLVLSVFALMLVAIPTAFGQAQSRPSTVGARQQVFQILGISVEGNSVADPRAIIANAGLKVGDEIALPSDQAAEAARRLWALRIFSDIQIIAERTVGTGVYLLIRVKEYPRLERIE